MSTRSALPLVLALAVVSPGGAAAPPVRPRDRFGDPLPPGAIARLWTNRWWHHDGFRQPLLSPDGRWLLSSSPSADRLFVWETATGRLMHTQEGGTFPRYAFLPGSPVRLLTVDGRQGEFSVWSFPSFALLKRWRAGSVDWLAVSPDGRFAAARRGGRIYRIDLRDGGERVLGYLPDGFFKALAVTGDGGVAALTESGAGFHWVRIDLLTKGRTHRVLVPTGSASCPTFPLSADARHVLTRSFTGRIELWRPRTGERWTPFALPQEGQAFDLRFSLSFSQDGKALVAIDRQHRTVWSYDLDRREVLARARLPDELHEDRLATPLLSADGRKVFLVGTLAVTPIDLRTGRVERSGPWGAPVAPLGWSGDGGAVLATSTAELTRWEAATGRRLDHVAWPARFPRMGERLRVPASVPRGGGVAVAEGNLLRLALAGTARGALTAHACRHERTIVALGFSADGRWLASVDAAQTLRIWDALRGRQRHVLDLTHTAPDVKGVVLARDGRQAILVEHSGRVHFLDVRSGKVVRTLRPRAEDGRANDPEMRMACVLSPGGNRLFLAYRGRLRSWDLRTDQEESRLEPIEDHPAAEQPALALSADGRFLAWREHQLYLYEAASGRIAHRFPGTCTAAAFHPTRRRLVVAGQDRLDTLLYDVGSVFRSPPAAGRSLAELWADLADRDAARGQRAVWALAVTSGMEEALGGRLAPVARLDPEWLKRQIGALGGDDFAARRRAERELRGVLEAAQGALREAQRRAGDLEHRLRLSRLVAELDPGAPQRLREHRAVLALEARGTPAARRLLARLAAGMPGAGLTEEAKAALGRRRSAGP